MIVEEIRKIADAENVAAIGFGPASAMDGAPPGYRPEDLLPGARGLVCFGIPLPQGVYGLGWADVVCRAQGLNYRRLDMISNRFAALLEEHGEQALPVYGCSPLVINDRGDVAGYLNQLQMAEATGIGVIGRNGLILHSRYGARLMLGGVVTTASLPSAHYPEIDEPGCPPGCRVCADACPVGAIAPDEKRVNIMKCLGYTSRTPLMSKLEFAILQAFRPPAAARLMNQTALDEHVLHICSKCVALCPYGDGAKV